MNVPFAIWVATRARRHAPIWVMFHEVAFPFHWRPVTHALLGTVTRAMARLVAGAADRVFSSIAAWGPLIQRLCPRAKKAEWLPIPSNLLEDRSIAAIRTSSGITIGHFGTYGPSTVQLLEPALISLLGASNRKAVLLGRGCVAFRDRFVAQYSSLADRLVSLGELPANELAAQLKGCDVLLQPFIDGISSRRTSVMACLSNGVPLVSNLGELSEPLWADLGCIGLAQRPNAVELITATEAILSMTPVERAAMGQRAAMEYRTRFSIENTISRLRDACPRTKA
jgi:glycosyltransferase involved in cell wall biosynthesis